MPFTDVLLRPHTHDSLYFCNYLYGAYRGNKRMIQRLICVDDHTEALLYCDKCSKKIVKYSKFKHCSREFFKDVKRNLSQHFVTESEPNDAFKNCVLVDYFTVC